VLAWTTTFSLYSSLAVTDKHARSLKIVIALLSPPSPWFSCFSFNNTNATRPPGTRAVALLPSLTFLFPFILFVSLSSSRWNRGPLRSHIQFADRLQAGDSRRIVVGYIRSSFDDRYTHSTRPTTGGLFCSFLFARFRILSDFPRKEMETLMSVDVLSRALVAFVCCIT